MASQPAARPPLPGNQKHKVSVRVPATSANLGPGFDALGMAVDIWNEITVERADEFSVHTEGEGSGGDVPATVDPATGDPLPPASPHLVLVALRRAFAHAGVRMPPVRVTSRNRVPVSSGFGSSSAAIVGGLIAGLVLAGARVRAAPRSAPAPGEGHMLPQTRGRDDG